MRQERKADLFCAARISQTVKEMSDNGVFPEANSLGSLGKPKKLVPLKARMESPGLQEMVMLLIDNYYKITMTLWNPSLSLSGRLAS